MGCHYYLQGEGMNETLPGGFRDEGVEGSTGFSRVAVQGFRFLDPKPSPQILKPTP